MATIPVPGDAYAIWAALSHASPGDVLLITSTFEQPKKGATPVAVVRGAADQPIVVTAVPGVELRGRASGKGAWASFTSKPDRVTPKCRDLEPPTGDPFIRLRNSAGVAFRGLTIRDAFPTAIDVSASSDIRFEDCTITGGRNVFRVRDPVGSEETARSSTIIVHGCRWDQDARLWNELSWDDVHDGAASYLNGALLRTDNVAGPVSFRHNSIRNAYNGIKCVAPRDRLQRESCNRNFDIHNNRFERIRDNPFEPEGYAYNWHLHHNTLVDCHGWFSFDGVVGGCWYIYANEAWFVSRQGDDRQPDGHRRGFVFKMALAPPEDLPDRVYVFNNSFHLRVPITGNAQDTAPFAYSIRNWFFHDNVFEWRAETQWSKPEDEPFVTAFEPGILFEPPFSFTGNVSNAMAGWHAFVERLGVSYGWQNHYVRGRIFEDGPRGNFELRSDLTSLPKALPFTMWLASRSTPYVMPAGRNAGARQSDCSANFWPPFEEV